MIQIVNATGVKLVFNNGSILDSLYNLQTQNSHADDVIAIQVGKDYVPVHPRRVNNFVDFPAEFKSLPRDSVIFVSQDVAFTLAARNQEVPCRIISPEGIFNSDGDFVVSNLHYWPDCKPPVMRETFEK